MKAYFLSLYLLAVLSFASGCATTSRSSGATVARHFGADGVVLEKLERGGRLSLPDLEELGRRGVPDEVVLQHLQQRGDVYRLTTAQVLQLREAGVTDRVIDYLLGSPERMAWRTRRGAPIWGYHNRIGHPYSGIGRGGWRGGGGHHHGGHHR